MKLFLANINLPRAKNVLLSAESTQQVYQIDALTTLLEPDLCVRRNSINLHVDGFPF